MKILYVLDSFPKLSETFILNEIVELIERGHEVEVLALRRPYEKSVNEDVLNYKLFHSTRYFRLPQPLRLRHGYLVSPDFYRSTFNTFKDYFSETTFTQFVRLSYYAPYYKDVDIVHSHFAFEAAVTGMQLSNILDKPFTFTAHAFEIFSHDTRSDVRLNTLVKNAARVITPSQFNKDYIIQQTGCSPEKIGIVRATIRLDKFCEIPRVKDDNTKIKILSVGRLVEKKGFGYLIKAMKTITEKNPSAFLNIIGDGELMADLKNLSFELGLSKSINFLGAQPNEICMEELSSSDIAVLPCVVAEDGDMDVCPLTLQEAMAMEVPVISTTVGSVPELIEDGKEGILVPQRDEKSLSKAIIRLIENPSLRSKMGKKGKDKVAKEFNIKTQADRILKTWGKVI